MKQKQELLYRAAAVDETAIDIEGRRVVVAFSSESPYQRSFGLEVLSHDPADVDMSFLASGNAPLLTEHETEDQIGIVESASIESGVGRAVVRFSRSPDGEIAWQDVVDGIKKNISVGYLITGKQLDQSATPPIVLCKWRPMEISLVAIPADETVGVGRTAELPAENKDNKNNKETKMENTEKDVVVETRAADIEVATKAERSRVADISDLAARHNLQDKGSEFIRAGKSIEEFRAFALDQIADNRTVTTSASINTVKKAKEEFSLARAIDALMRNDWSEAKAEQRMSNETAEEFRKPRSGTSFHIPSDYLEKRTQASVTANGQLVGTDHLGGSFIEMLYAQSVSSQLGVTFLNGLVGNVEIPKLTVGTTAYEVAEGVDITESAVTTALVTLAPRQFGVLIPFSRKLGYQSQPLVEQVLRQDIMANLAQQIDKIVFAKLIASGTINWMPGSTNGAAPTYANLLKAVNNVALNNALNDNCKWAINPATQYFLQKTVKDANTAAVYLMDAVGKSLVGYDAVMTTNMPSNITKGTGTNLSAALFGNFADVVVGNWSPIELAIDTSKNFASGGSILRAFVDMDCAIRRDVSFSGFKDIITT